MRLKTLSRPRSRPAIHRPPFRRVFRPLLEMLESGVVPSTIDYRMGFVSHGDLQNNGTAVFTGSVARLTDGMNVEAGSVFTKAKFDITHFSTNFTFVLTPGTSPIADGITFTIQDDLASASALGFDGGGLGYGSATPGGPIGITHSVAIKFDLIDNAGEGINSTGIFTGGRSPTIRQPGLDSQFPDMSITMDGSGINLHSQDQFQVTLTYDGSTLTESVHDNTTGATFTHSYSLTISSIVGSSTAYLGFTGATGELAAVQDIQTWTGDFGPPNSPTLTSLSLKAAKEGTGSLTLTFNGTNFSSNSIAQWDGTNLATTFQSPSQLTVIVPASLLAEEGTAAVTVFNPSPDGGVTSGAQTFTITDAPLTGSPVTFSPIQGMLFTGVVATFTDANSNAPVSDFTATILWGDGNTSAGTIASLDGGNFSVSGTNTYIGEATYVVGVAITDDGGSTTTVNSTAQVADAPITAAGVNFNVTEGVAFSGVVVATFIDADPNATPASYPIVSITWGDGQQTTGTVVVNPNGGFAVLGSHTYAEEGNYTLQVFIQDAGGATATATSMANVEGDLPLTVTGLDITATVSVAQDFTVAEFTDPDPNAHAGSYAVPINWGDGTAVQAGRVTQPGGPGTPFFVDATHAYSDTGTFTIHVRIFDEAGSFAETFSTATVLSTAAPGGPGRDRGARPTASVAVDVMLLGRERRLEINELQLGPGQQFQGEAFEANSNAESAALLGHSATSLQSRQTSAAVGQASPI